MNMNTLQNNSYLNNFTDERHKINTLNKKINDLPTPNTKLWNGVTWGSYNEIFTPAYWKLQYLIHEDDRIKNKLGTNILEEITACMLGGFGIPSNVGLIAYHRMKENGLIKPGVNESKIKEALSEPIVTPSGKKVYYRFVNQKSKYISSFLNREDISDIPISEAFELREWLLRIKGIGFKTASWITRNWLESDKVAIIDIHLLRAGRLTGIFPEVKNINNQYLTLESTFIKFCEKLNVKASIMDAIIWHQMRRSNKYVINLLNAN